jgi:subtilisin-like proprotein convertase family protein
VKFRTGLVVCCLAWFVASALQAQTNATLRAPRYEVADGGQRRIFEIALDEVHVRVAPGSPVRQVVPLDQRAATAEGVRAVAESRAKSRADAAELVLYEAGQPRSAATRRLLTKEILVRVRPGVSPAAIAEANGLVFRGPALPGSDYLLFEATKTGGALEAARALQARGDIISAQAQLARQQQKRLAPNDTLFTQQWHLLNTGQSGGLAGTDVNLTSVWDEFRGTGIRIGIVDDGLQLTHPDLSSNLDTVNDRDWNDATPNDPSPDVTFDFHGTSCAGVAAARGGNARGVSGAAPEATLVGLRLISAPTTDLQEAEAMSWKNDLIEVKSNSWGPFDDGRTLEAPGPLTLASLADAVANGRDGLGTIFVWAGGNGGSFSDNANYDGYANAPETIAVGAITNTGKRSGYSEPGANLVVSAPSSGGSLGILTTDLIGNNGYNTASVFGEVADRDYTNDFGGTSSATPLVAGCIALILEANPGLGWRDVQEILMRSAKQIDPTNVDWITNPAGFRFNHNFGAGMVDTQAAVALAKTWTNLGPRTQLSATQSALNITIPDNHATGITRQFDLSASNLRVEHVTVRISIVHASRGNLAITLTSPSGTVSRLAEKRSDTGDDYSEWTFTTVRNWGEDAQGAWKLTVADLTSGTIGRLNSATITVFGTATAPVNQPPSVTDAAVTLTGTVFENQTIQVSSVTASDPDGDSIALAYQWQESVDRLVFTNIAGATSQSFTPIGLTGRLVRCLITPTAAGKSGAGFATPAIGVNRRPPSFAQHGQAFSYDSDLFLSVGQSDVGRRLIISELSQGSSGSKEWVELLVLQTTDLRGYTMSDRLGRYVTFSTSGMWAAVPAGTLVVIYNGNDRDTLIPTDQSDPINGAIIQPHTNTTAFSTRAWGGLSNSNAESVIVRDAQSQIIDAISINRENVYDPKLGTVSTQQSVAYQGDTDAGADVLENWKTSPFSLATPAAGNSVANTQFVTDLRSGALNAVPKYRFATGSDVIPGLTLDENTGILQGVPNVPAGGLFHIVLERVSSTESANQSFDVLIAGLDQSATIPAGETWTLSNNTTIPGNLLIAGTIDTSGHTLTVLGDLNITTATAISNASGVIVFGHLIGSNLPGKYTLAPDPVRDLADPDQDSAVTLMEFAFGSNPAVPDDTTYLIPTVIGGVAHYTYRFPAGAVGVTRVVEVSKNLFTWQSGPEAVEVVTDNVDGAGIRTITVRDITGGDRSFGRIRVSR